MPERVTEIHAGRDEEAGTEMTGWLLVDSASCLFGCKQPLPTKPETFRDLLLSAA